MNYIPSLYRGRLLSTVVRTEYAFNVRAYRYFLFYHRSIVPERIYTHRLNVSIIYITLYEYII